ncbi:hypothetical protein ABZ153_31240 [Streptomyces sp. NPDC006290]|uniref:hypothetical protein n=1 Tax=Streptomyces sp. NPDC006290 TaxID=3156745 RepID=UPI0033B2D4A7
MEIVLQLYVPITVVRGAGRRLTWLAPAAPSRSRTISSCCAASRIVDGKHRDGLPKDDNRRVTTGDIPPQPRHRDTPGTETGPLMALLNRSAATRVEVGRRPLSVYDELTGTRPFTIKPTPEDPR